MRQDDYEIILSCIKYGAPALSDKLIIGFNTCVEAENNLINLRREAENARKAELARKAKSRKPRAQKFEQQHLDLPATE